jgi:hypothetical protein
MVRLGLWSRTGKATYLAYRDRIFEARALGSYALGLPIEINGYRIEKLGVRICPGQAPIWIWGATRLAARSLKPQPHVEEFVSREEAIAYAKAQRTGEP